MIFSGMCLIGMLVVFKFSGTPERWWIALAIILTTAAMFGMEIGIFSLAIVIGVWKVFSDLCQA